MSEAASSLPVTPPDELTLPVLLPGLPYLLTALGDEDVDFDVLTTAIRSFPSIAGRLVALANSAWVSPKRPVISLQEACAVLGLRMVRCVSFALAVGRPFDPSRCPGFDVERYWCTALLTAEGAALLSPHLGDECHPDTAHTAGLLHNLGLMWLADSQPTQTAAALQVAAADEGFDVAQALYAATGSDYCLAGGRLSEAWQLPDTLITAIRYHRSPEYRGPHWPFAAGCGVAAQMSALIWHGMDWVPETIPHSALAIPPAVLQSIFLQLESKRDSIRHLSQTLFAQG